MTTARIEAGILKANLQERIVSGLLLPFGEVGRTNLGRFSVDKGVITIPSDVSVLMANADHQQTEPRARFIDALETDAGIVGMFQIGTNPEGDQLLLEIDEGIKTGKPKALSAEVKDMVLKAGRAVSGVLTGAAFVNQGAFPSATLMAADAGPDEDEEQPPAEEPVVTEDIVTEEFVDADGVSHKRKYSRKTEVKDGQTVITTKEIIEDPEPPTNTEEEAPTVGAATVPNTLQASSAPADKGQITKGQVFDLMARVAAGQADSTLLARLEEAAGPQHLFAALSDIKYDGTGGLAPVMTVPQWIGNVYEEKTYERKFAPLFNHADLTALKINGWRWKTKPVGGTWAGNKTAVPSAGVEVEAYTTAAKRFAGAHDHAREHVDFGTPGYFESYWSAMVESYEQWADETVVLTDILAAAPTVVADNPSGLAIGSGMSALIDGAAQVISANATPTFALVATALWKQIAKTPTTATLGYLSAALGLKDGQLDGFVIRPTDKLAVGNVLVGAREAATVYELPGTPVRVDAQDLARGGVDTGLFGYAGTVVNKANALIRVTPFGA